MWYVQLHVVDKEVLKGEKKKEKERHLPVKFY